MVGRMSIRRYLKPIDGLPDPKGSLPTTIPSAAIASANREDRYLAEFDGHTPRYAAINVTPHPPLYGDRWGIGGDLTHRMCQIPHPSITIQCQIPTLYIHTRICAGTRANACAGQKPHPWGVISWRIPYQAPPLSPTGGGGA